MLLITRYLQMAGIIGAHIRGQRKRQLTADSASRSAVSASPQNTQYFPIEGGIVPESGRSSADWQNYRESLIHKEQEVY